MPVQSPQVLAPAHGSASVHSVVCHFQSVQLPMLGPALEPASQLPVSPQKPQGKFAVHSPQVA